MCPDDRQADHPQATVARKLRRMGRTRARLDQLQADMERELAHVRSRYEGRVASLGKRIEQQRGDLEDFCRSHRDAVLPPGRKTLTTPFGEVAFRRSEPSVRVREGMSEDEACRLLRGSGLGDLVRVREAPDRSAVRRAVRENRLSEEQLHGCGLAMMPGADRFHCKVWQDALVGVGRSR